MREFGGVIAYYIGYFGVPIIVIALTTFIVVHLFSKKNNNLKNNIKFSKRSNSKNYQEEISEIINTGIHKQVTQDVFISNIVEDKLYEKVWNEIENNTPVKSIWARIFSECNGDNDKTKSLYIKSRIASLKEEYLKEQHENFIKKIEAEHKQRLELTEKRYKDGKGINDYDDNATNPLIRATNKGDSEMVGLLLKLGADPNTEYLGSSLKGLARQKKLNNILQLLEKYS